MASGNAPAEVITVMLNPINDDKAEGETKAEPKTPVVEDSKSEVSGRTAIHEITEGGTVVRSSVYQLPTGDDNTGIGAGAINEGEGAGSIINQGGGTINFNAKEYGQRSAPVPSNGNKNKGIGAGALNVGKYSGSIIGTGEINYNLDLLPEKNNNSALKEDGEGSGPVPSSGNKNRGPGAGDFNAGKSTTSIINDGVVKHYK